MADTVRAFEIRNQGPQHDSWPAQFPQISYVLADGGFVCVTCANGGNGSLASTDTDDPQWRIVGAQVNLRDTQCDHCYRTISAAPQET